MALKLQYKLAENGFGPPQPEKLSPVGDLNMAGNEVSNQGGTSLGGQTHSHHCTSLCFSIPNKIMPGDRYPLVSREHHGFAAPQSGRSSAGLYKPSKKPPKGLSSRRLLLEAEVVCPQLLN
jgi:hypothetical protein